MSKLLVKHDQGNGEWVTAVREDLYDGTNDEVLTQPAEFHTHEDADKYINEIRGLMHIGGDDVRFRVVRKWRVM